MNVTDTAIQSDEADTGPQPTTHPVWAAIDTPALMSS
jgi:hypothetical protein